MLPTDTSDFTLVERIHWLNDGPIQEALRLLPAKMDTLNARGQLIKIALQESRGIHRDQLTTGPDVLGPALGLWQCEKGGAVRGVLNHAATRDYALRLCVQQGVTPITAENVWKALLTDDVLAAGLARLNLWWAAKPLPHICDETGSWAYYMDTWRPGKPHIRTWNEFHVATAQALR